MHLQAVCVYLLLMAAQMRKAKIVLAFLDEVLHIAPPTVKPDNIFRGQGHVRDDEHEAVLHAPLWLLDLAYHTPWGIP